MSLDEKLIDKRVVARKLEQGHVDGDAYRQMLNELPDLSEQVAKEDDATTTTRRQTDAPPPPVEREAPGL